MDATVLYGLAQIYFDLGGNPTGTVEFWNRGLFYI